MSDLLNFDLALILSSTALNQIAAQVYANKPSLFHGSVAGQAEGQAYSIDFQVNEAPQFDLSASNAAALAYRSGAADRIRRQGFDLDALPGTRTAAEALVKGEGLTNNAFTVINSLSAQVALGSAPPGAALQFTATIHASISTSSSGGIALSAQDIELAPSQPSGPPIDPFTRYVINTYAAPSVLQMVNQLLSAVQPPSFQLAGLTLSAPTCAVMSNSLVACLLVAGGQGASGVLSDAPPVSGVGILLSQRGLQTAVAAGVAAITSRSPIKGSGKSGGSGFDAHYSYELDFGTPEVAIAGEAVNLTMALRGSAFAGIKAFWVPFNVGYAAYASPTPTAVLQPHVVNGELWIALKSMNTVAVVLVPSGDVSSEISGALAWLVVEPVVAAVSAAATGTIKNLSFHVLQAPPLSFRLAGFSVVAEATNVGFQQSGANALLSGDIQIHVSDTAPSAASGLRSELAMPQEGEPVTVPMLLWPGAAAGQTASGGLYFAGSCIECGQATITQLSDTSLAVRGQFNVDTELEGHSVKTAGTFQAQLSETGNGVCNVGLQAETTDGRHVSWQTSFDASLVNGQPTLTGIVDAASPVPVQITFQVQNGQGGAPSIVYAFPQITGPGGQPLPAGYIQCPPPSGATH